MTIDWTPPDPNERERQRMQQRQNVSVHRTTPPTAIPTAHVITSVNEAERTAYLQEMGRMKARGKVMLLVAICILGFLIASCGILSTIGRLANAYKP